MDIDLAADAVALNISLEGGDIGGAGLERVDRRDGQRGGKQRELPDRRADIGDHPVRPENPTEECKFRVDIVTEGQQRAGQLVGEFEFEDLPRPQFQLASFRPAHIEITHPRRALYGRAYAGNPEAPQHLVGPEMCLAKKCRYRTCFRIHVHHNKR